MNEVELNEALAFLNNKELNSKCNNYIFTDLTKKQKQEFLAGIKREIPVKINPIADPGELFLPSTMFNIPLDLSLIPPKDVLNYALDFIGIPKKLDYNSKFDLLKCRGILREYQKCLSLILYNSEDIPKEKRILLNEIYYFNSCFLTINDVLESSNLSTYEISNNRLLDARDDYTRIRIK